MLSGIVLFVLIYCFWCHKNDRKSDPQLSNYGDYPDLPPEVYTVGSADHVSNLMYLLINLHVWFRNIK